MINTNWISRASIATRAKVVAGKQFSATRWKGVFSRTVRICYVDQNCFSQLLYRPRLCSIVAAIVISAGSNYTRPVSIRTIDRNRGWTKRSMTGTKETRSSFSFSFQRDYVTLIARNAFDSETGLALCSNSSSGSIRRVRVSKLRKYDHILFVLRSKLFSFSYHWEPWFDSRNVTSLKIDTLDTQNWLRR